MVRPVLRIRRFVACLVAVLALPIRSPGRMTRGHRRTLMVHSTVTSQTYAHLEQGGVEDEQD